ncbi:MAG: hypothetical protein JWO45_2102 [Spartobacteria bacterium]|nr:hypothetical protein [Spartobacteria bacterium]
MLGVRRWTLGVCFRFQFFSFANKPFINNLSESNIHRQCEIRKLGNAHNPTYHPGSTFNRQLAYLGVCPRWLGLFSWGRLVAGDYFDSGALASVEALAVGALLSSARTK